jgi:hypothetical protein
VFMDRHCYCFHFPLKDLIYVLFSYQIINKGRSYGAVILSYIKRLSSTCSMEGLVAKNIIKN